MPNGMPADSGNRVHSTLGKSPDIIFLPDMFGGHTSGPENEKELPFDTCLQSRSPKLLPARRNKPPKRRVTFQEPTRQQPLVHPLFRRRPESPKAGDITPLDHWIARHGGTTSSFEELPHRIKSSKDHQPLTPEERVEELTRGKSFLLQELVYHKETRAAEMRFMKKVTELRAGLEAVLTEFDCGLQKRLRD